MPYPIRLDGLLAKLEGTYGTDSVPVVGTDAVRVSERVFSSLTLEPAFPNLRENVSTGTLLPIKPALPRGRMATIDIAWEAKGAGSDVPPEADPLFRACGAAQTDGTQLFSYAQASLNHESCTVYAYAGGFLYKVVGCRGVFSWPIVAGQLGLNRFRLRGIVTSAPIDTALPGGFVYDATEPLAAVGMALTLGAWTPDIVSAEFRQGVDPERLDSANGADGLKEFDYGEANPRFVCTVRTPASLATFNAYADELARTARAIALTMGNAQFDREKLAVTNAYLVNEPRHVPLQGFTGWELEFLCADWTVTFD